MGSAQGWTPEEQSSNDRFVDRKLEQDGGADDVSNASFPASELPGAEDGSYQPAVTVAVLNRARDSRDDWHRAAEGKQVVRERLQGV